ncbi:MAG: cytochrome c [Gemmatimonadota bacterium]|nr:cytochrome c [Gemmatimonadota bacterium]HEU4989351.1 cytochrome c [Gemmatimonadaceae bacterium]
MKTPLLIVSLVLATAAASSVQPARQGADGKALYNENCRKCHGVIGMPPKTMKAKFPKIPTFNAEFIAAHSQDSIVKVLTHGKNEDMKSFADKLKPDEMKAVAAYVHELGAKH